VQTPLAFPPFDFTAALNSAALFLAEAKIFLYLLDIFGSFPGNFAKVWLKARARVADFQRLCER